MHLLERKMQSARQLEPDAPVDARCSQLHHKVLTGQSSKERAKVLQNAQMQLGPGLM